MKFREITIEEDTDNYFYRRAGIIRNIKPSRAPKSLRLIIFSADGMVIGKGAVPRMEGETSRFEISRHFAAELLRQRREQRLTQTPQPISPVTVTPANLENTDSLLAD